MAREFKRIRLKDMDPFKWYKTALSASTYGRYCASSGVYYGHQPILLTVHKYVAATAAGRMEMKTDILGFHSAELSEVTVKEYNEVKRAIKNSKTNIVHDLFYYMFTSTG